MPPVRPLAPEPMPDASNTATDFPGASWPSQAAAARPVKPPPIIAKSTDEGMGRLGIVKSICQGEAPQVDFDSDSGFEFRVGIMAGLQESSGPSQLESGRSGSERTRSSHYFGMFRQLELNIQPKYLENAFCPVLERVLHFPHELVSHRSVDDAVIVGKREIHHGADRDRIINHNRALLDRAQPENRDVRLVDYRKAEEAAEGAGVRNRKRALGYFLGLQFLRARAFRQVVERTGDAEEVLLFGVLDHRDDQSPI